MQGLHRRLSTRLDLESLEQRSLLAVAAFEINLYTDDGGVPGALIDDNTVVVGETFFAEIIAEDLLPTPRGFGGIALDISWDPDVFDEADSSFDPATLITPKLPYFQTGTLYQQAGIAFDLGGAGWNPDDPFALAGPERFALLKFQAEQPAVDSPLELDLGAHNVAHQPPVWTTSADFLFETELITVVEASSSSEQQTATLAASAAPTAINRAALVGVDVNLYEDNNGQQGALISDNTLEIGDAFFVETVVQDLRDTPAGVGGLSIDVSWDSSVLESLDVPFAPGDLDGDLVTTAFPTFRSGSLDSPNGIITNLGGASLRSVGNGRAIGASGPEQFSLLRFRAIGLAEVSPLSIEVGAGGVGIVDGQINDASQVEIESPSIHVVEKLEPPRIEIVKSSGSSLNSIEFTTQHNADASTPTTSPLVRPAFPDQKQFVEIVNSGPSPLTIHAVDVNAPDVSTDLPATELAQGIVVAPDATLRIGLTYAPGLPTTTDASTQSFNLDGGLVIHSDAENTPELKVGLEGHSTFNGDINYDGQVNLVDVVRFDDVFGLDQNDAEYSGDVDPNGDGSVDLGDFGVLNVDFGRSRSQVQDAALASLASDSSEADLAPRTVQVGDDVAVALAVAWSESLDDEDDDRLPVAA